MAANVKQWKKNLVEAQKLRGTSMGILYDRVRLLVSVFEDPEFRADNHLEDDFAADNFLSAEVDEFRTTGSTFLALRAILVRFPDRKEWIDATLPKLIATMDQERAEARAKELPERVRKVATVKELEAEKERADYAEKTVKHLERRVADIEHSSQESIAELHAKIAAKDAEIDQLREDNALLRGRIAELERLLSRELVAA